MLSDTLFNEIFTQLWFRFGLVTMFGFLTGLEFLEYTLLRHKEAPDVHTARMGSTRTFTFIAILGYVLFILDPAHHLYLTGMAGLILLFSLFYYHKLGMGSTGLLQPLILLIVYSYGAVITTLPIWFLALLFVAVVFTLSARPLSQRLTTSMDPQEIVTLAKFLLLSGVILPLLPDKSISPYIPATPFKIWLAVVLISAISYTGYILKKYLLKKQGYLVTGLMGGLYSSTATTVVLARKSRSLPVIDSSINAGIIAASGIMYLRLLVLVAVMNWQLLTLAMLPLSLFGVLTIGFAFIIDRRGRTTPETTPELGKANPLDLGIALLFAVLFVIMMLITQQVISRFGEGGLNILSLAVGFTDIDPFVLSILSGHYAGMNMHHLVGAIIIAAGSNNILKSIYAVILGGRKNCGMVAGLLLVLALMTIAYGLAISNMIIS